MCSTPTRSPRAFCSGLSDAEVVNHRYSVGIVGAGTAGSAAALFLARAGHSVTVYERVADPHPIGAGIVLQPTGLAVMRLLGLDTAVLSHAERIDRLWCTTPSNRTVVDLSYEVVSPEAFGLGLHRGVLFRTLFDAVKAEPGITVRLGACCDDLEESALGTTLIDAATGERHGPHDVVIVCNGARSSLRDDTAHHKSVIKYPWGALWAVLPDVDARYRGVLRQVVNGTRRLIGLLPTGRGPNGDQRLVSLFFSLRSDQLAQFRAGDFSEWKASVIRDVPESAPVVQQLATTNDLLFSEYHDVVMWPWNTERVVYLGDAAHAMSPQLGQGCNLALLDAWYLAEAMRGAESVPDALFRYSRNRRWHLTWYQFITRWLTPFFQSDLAWLSPLRDYGMAWSVKVPWVRKQMVSAMCGVSRGPFMPLLKLPSLDSARGER